VPDAWLAFDLFVAEALTSIKPGDDRAAHVVRPARRDVVKVYPHGDATLRASGFQAFELASLSLRA
jgi:hypothetical protein